MYRVKIATAELMTQSGNLQVATPLLERLVEEVKNMKVVDWDNNILSKTLRMLVDLYDKLDKYDKLDSKISEQKRPSRMNAFDQLCWFDPISVAD
jgi:hypothetical protein